MAGVKWYGEGVFLREAVRGDGQSARWIWPLVPGALFWAERTAALLERLAFSPATGLHVAVYSVKTGAA